MRGGIEALALYSAIRMWGVVIVGSTFILGLIIGPSRIAGMLGHLWGTEEPENQ